MEKAATGGENQCERESGGNKVFHDGRMHLVVKDPASDRERIFLVSLRQFLVRLASA
jgi:hypothetical protein